MTRGERMDQITLPTSLPISEDLVREKFLLKSKEPAIVIDNGKQRELLENWINAGLDIHLSTIVCVDEQDRFDLLYYFMNRYSYETLVLVVQIPKDNPMTPSITDLLDSRYYEGEIREMFGVIFEGNDIDNVFLPEDWQEGHPLRKDWVKPSSETTGGIKK